VSIRVIERERECVCMSVCVCVLSLCKEQIHETKQAITVNSAISFLPLLCPTLFLSCFSFPYLLVFLLIFYATGADEKKPNYTVIAFFGLSFSHSLVSFAH